MQAQVRQQDQYHRHALWMLDVLEQHGRRECQQGQQRVGARDHRVLVDHEIGEGERPADDPGKRRFEDQQRRSGGGAGHADVAERAILRVEDVLRHPQDGVPQAGRALVAQFMKPDGAQTEIARNQPGLRLVRPLLVILNGEADNCNPQAEHAEVPNPPPWTVRRSSGRIPRHVTRRGSG